MPRKPRQERSKATVEALIDAGFKVVAERGLAGTTAQHVADRAGVGIGSFYEYFANKEALFAEMFRRMGMDIVQLIQVLTPDLVRMDIRAAIRYMLSKVSELLRRDDGVYLPCAQQALRAPEHVVDREPVQRALINLAMQYLMHNPEYLRTQNASVGLYIFIHGGMQAFMHHLNEKNPAISFEQLVDGLANMIGHYAEREMQLLKEKSQPA